MKKEMKMDGYMKVGIPSALKVRKVLSCQQQRTPFLWSTLKFGTLLLHKINISVLKLKSLVTRKYWAKMTLFLTTKTILITLTVPHKNRGVVEAEVLTSGIPVPKTSLLFAQSCRSCISFSNTSPIYKFISIHTLVHARTHTHTRTLTHSQVRHFLYLLINYEGMN